MDKNDIQLLIDYNYWANARILRAAEMVTPEQFHAPFPVSFGSLRGSLVHILGTEIVWRMRCHEGISLPALASEQEYPDLASIQQHWSAEETLMRAYIASLNNASLSRVVQYKTTRGVQTENVLGQLLYHLVNHGTQFRAEAGVALTSQGHSPGDIDLLLYLREKAAQLHT
jgi:uncharacterized damage-inducible protein DinB